MTSEKHRVRPAAQVRIRPRVLHLDHSTEAGGAELALLRVLQNSGNWQATLSVPRFDGESVFSALKSQPSVVLLEKGRPQLPGASNGSSGVRRMAKYAADALGVAFRLRFSAEFKRADVIHTNTSRSAVYGAIASLFTSKVLVVHLRDMASADSLGSLGFRLFSQVALRRADAVIANSAATLATAAPFLRVKAERFVIPSPIGFDQRVETHRVSRTVHSIGMVARIDPWKGHDVLLRAFADGCKGTDIRLVLAGGAAFGKGSDLQQLRDLAKSLGIDSQVDFLGHVDNVRAVIDDLDICVQASTRPEPLGQNVLQYLVAGKPTIAVNAGGPAEWIISGSNGLLVEMASVRSLADAISKLVGSEALRQRLATAASKTEGIGTDAEIAEAHGRAFSQLVEKRRTK